MNSQNLSKQITSPLRYPGGKGLLMEYFVEIMKHNDLEGCCYYEPFAGGAGVALGLLSNGRASKIVLNVGFSHPVEVEIPEGVTVEVEKNQISIKGANKEDVGQFAANVRAVKKPEPYKGKGIRYSDEVVRRKEGKRAAA